MSKLDMIRREMGRNIAESTGTGLNDPRERIAAGVPATPSAPARLQGLTKVKNVAEIPVAKIERDPDQPREEFDEEALGRLAESLKAKGQLQPIRVRWNEDRGRYIVLCGERRWRAAQLAGMATMTAMIVDGPMTGAERLTVQLVENALREDLQPIEQARAYKKLMELNGWSGSQVARELAIAQSAVVKALALLELPAPVQDLVEQGTLRPATAYEVSKIHDPQAQAEVAAQVIRENLTRDEAIEVIRRASGASPRGGKGRAGGGSARAKDRKVTSRSFRAAGCRIVVENKRGLEDRLIETALEEALAQVKAARPDRDEVA